MKLQKSPYKNSCLPTSLAMCLGLPAKEVLSLLGDHGNEKLFPKLPDPACYRGWHIQEIVDLCLKLGYSITEVEMCPVFGAIGTSDTKRLIPTYEMQLERMIQQIRGEVAILYVQGNWSRHAVAWDGYEVYDPKGKVAQLIDYQIYSAFLIRESCSMGTA